MVNDPDTNSIVIWSKSGTSFFVKDSKGLQDDVQERFNHTSRTFYKKLGEFVNISNIKEKKQITKCDMLNVKRCIENASKRIAQKAKGERRVGLPSVDSQPQTYAMRKLKQDGGRQPWLSSTKTGVNADIEKIKQDLYRLNVQILNSERGYTFIEDQLAAIERIFPGTYEKQEEIELFVNKLFMNPKAIPRKRSQENESPDQAMKGNDHSPNQEELTINFESQEANSIFNHLMKDDIPSNTDVKHDDLMALIKVFEGELTSS
ncbi:hypothetical protein L1987_31603 [Smallanthus sonchifolius]|uniref:Uncharacterized protein n=1 Tax=Smallanthus sonchifolius TaxID=185202 RepID=A0ACB9I6T0_9ASTR|nr:hypothetical protein L1987_31603 [Smallanthus sonchifolius]